MYRLSDLSDNSHTSEYFLETIKDVINSVGNEKFVAVVSDNIANVKKTRELIHEEFPFIQNVRCIAHCINLLAGDIVKHNFADRLLKKVNTFSFFFRNTTLSGNISYQFLIVYNYIN